MTSEDDALRLEAAERARLIAAWEETRNEAFLRAACCLRRESRNIDRADVYRFLNEPESRGRGNVDKNDRDLLDSMAFLMLTEKLKRWPAAVRVAAEHPDTMVEPTSIAKRLDGKFAKNPGPHLEFARFVLRSTDVAQRTHERVLRFPRKSKN